MNKKGKKSSQAEEDLCRDLDEILLGLDSFQKLCETEVSNLSGNHAKMQDRAKQGIIAPRVKSQEYVWGKSYHYPYWITILSSDQNPGDLLYIGDEILPSFIAIMINHETRIPTNQPV